MEIAQPLSNLLHGWALLGVKRFFFTFSRNTFSFSLSQLSSHSTEKSLSLCSENPTRVQKEKCQICSKAIFPRLNEEDSLAARVIASQICDFTFVLFNLRRLLSTQSSHSLSGSFQMSFLLSNISACSPWFGTKIEEWTSFSLLLCPVKMICPKGLEIDSYKTPLFTALQQ